MIKKIIVLLTLSLVICSTHALAHTSLKSSTPSAGEVLTQSVYEVILFFEGKVEQTSTLKVLDSNGQAVNLESVSIKNGVMTGIFSNPLKNGEYLVKWKTIGADAHPINGEFSFAIEVIEKPKEIKVQTENPIYETKAPIQSKNVVIDEQPKSSDHEEYRVLAILMPSVAAVFSIAGVGLLGWLLRRK